MVHEYFGVNTETLVRMRQGNKSGALYVFSSANAIAQYSIETLVELGNRVPIEQVERIEIIRGPGSVIHGGSAELAVINTITRSAKDLEGGRVTAIYSQMFDGAIHHGQSLADSFSRRTISAAFGRTFGDSRELSLKAGFYVGQGNRSDQPYVDIDGTTYNMAGNARTDPMLFHFSADYRGLKVGYLFEYYRTTMKDGFGTMLEDRLPVDYLSSSFRSAEGNGTDTLVAV
jgi:outer membrane receptor for ferrienterochelin and colicins